MNRTTIILVMSAAALAGCSTARETSPPRTATEQLLVSTAADAAAAKVSLPLESGTPVFVETANVDGADAKYAVAALREQLMRSGARIAADRAKAEVVVDFRAGALSVDEEEFLVGIPSYDIPVPLAGPLRTPEFALFKRDEKRGVAKFTAVAYRADTGDFVGSSDAQYGFSYKREWKLFFVISWGRDNLLPDEHRPEWFQIQPPRFLGPES